MRTTAALLVFALGSTPHVPVIGHLPTEAGSRAAVRLQGALPPGWSARTDRSAPLRNVNFRAMGDGWHVTLGPAVVLYREADNMIGPHRVSATFVQTKAPQHPEGYGLIVGGRNLQGVEQSYTYCLVRGDGKYLVKYRSGESTNDVTAGWVSHPAVDAQNAEGRASNDVAIEITSDKLRCEVNGVAVHEMNAPVQGIAGMRVNHNLDLHIDDYSVARP